MDRYGNRPVSSKRVDDILFRVRTRRFLRQFRLTMPGLFNVENALAAIAVCEGLSIPESCVYVGLMKARVPGRMEVYSNADSTVTAIVDYAHNRMSFETLFRVKTRRFLRQFRLTMPGLFNVENALAAIALSQALNIPESCVYVGLMKARVPGRMEVYTNADDTVTAIVDSIPTARSITGMPTES